MQAKRFYASHDLSFAEIIIEDGEFKEVTVETTTGGFCIKKAYKDALEQYNYAIDFIHTHRPVDIKEMVKILNDGDGREYCRQLTMAM